MARNFVNVQSMRIKVVNKYTHTPTDCDYYIGRGSNLGNPYTHIKHKKTKAEYVCDTREEAISAYRGWIQDKIDKQDVNVFNSLGEIINILEKHNEINLICFCTPKECHGDILKEIIEKIFNTN